MPAGVDACGESSEVCNVGGIWLEEAESVLMCLISSPCSDKRRWLSPENEI